MMKFDEEERHVAGGGVVKERGLHCFGEMSGVGERMEYVVYKDSSKKEWNINVRKELTSLVLVSSSKYIGERHEPCVCKIDRYPR